MHNAHAKNTRCEDTHFSLDRERDRLLCFSFLSRSRSLSLDFLQGSQFHVTYLAFKNNFLCLRRRYVFD